MRTGERPRASGVARHLAQRGNRLINLRHENMEVYDLHARLVKLLDGTRTREDLAREMKMPLVEVERALAALTTAAFMDA
jgi:hypothetical protein